jgi:hypothetical protein
LERVNDLANRLAESFSSYNFKKKRKPIEFPASVISRIHGVLLLAMATDAELISNFV